MCGICGKFNYAKKSPVKRLDLERMASSIAHRGPDDEGFFMSGPLGLGFRRLSIIDLAGGHQPMSDADESVWVAFNGEIYNYPELKQELVALGHVFRTKSDTEVIVHGYKHWGDDVFNHLNGMFGVAIWDVRLERLLVARDRFGIKLIYYRDEGGVLQFGSEIRAVVATSDELPEVDPVSLNLFLRYRYTPSPRTIYRGIHKLAPGAMLVCEGGQVSVRQWYRYAPSPFVPPKSIEQAQDELLELYKQAMKRHLLSDVPVGLLLSGGIDSGMLLALMNLYGKDWRTYTVGYGEGFADDELNDAERTSLHFGSNHSEIRLDREQFDEALRTIVACVEEPIATSSIVPMYFVCQRARQDVKVALVGQGPDELFGGYRRHLGVRYGAAWASLPGGIRSVLSSAIAALPRNETLKRGLHSLILRERERRYQNVLSLLPEQDINGVFQDGWLDASVGDEILRCWSDLLPLIQKTDELGGFQYLEMRSTLPDELLMYGDKLSMAHGLEARVPYLDKEVVEYVERLPADLKVRNGSRKWLHRRVCEGFLPAEMLRRKKRGFAVNVVDDWFRGTMSKKLDETLMDDQSMLYRYLRPGAVQSMVKQHRLGRSDYHKMLFSLVVFEEWLRVRQSADRALAS